MGRHPPTSHLPHLSLLPLPLFLLLPSSTVAAKCPPGKSAALADGEPPCTSCVTGMYQPAQGISECLPCAKGKRGHQSASDGSRTTESVSCENCGAGKYTTVDGRPTCDGTLCAPGTFGAVGRNSLATATCTACASGRHVNTNGAITCLGTACAAGKFGPLGTTSSAAATCTDCDGGRFTGTPGLAACAGCAAGFYQTQAGQSSCTMGCPKGEAEGCGARVVWVWVDGRVVGGGESVCVCVCALDVAGKKEDGGG